MRLQAGRMTKGTFIDLFAGIGGFHYALRELGYKCLLAVEMNADCQAVYFRNHKLRPEGDIRELTHQKTPKGLSERTDTELRAHLMTLMKNKGTLAKGSRTVSVDFICGGFPCQPFSKSGAQRGTKDKTRGTLFHDILLITSALMPKHLILENVRNLAGPQHKKTLETIFDELRKLGYLTTTKPVFLSPHQLPKPYGAPQARERVYILATRKDLGQSLPKPDHVRRQLEADYPRVPQKWKIGTILDSGLRNAEAYGISKNEAEWLDAWDEFAKGITGQLPGFPLWLDAMTGKMKAKRNDPNWKKDFIKKNRGFYLKSSNRKFIASWIKDRNVKEFPSSRRKFEWQARQAQPSQETRDLAGLAIQLRPSGIRVKPPTHLPALVAITQTSIVGPSVPGNMSGKYRRITPAEAAQLQGMPKTIDFGKQGDPASYRQLGNAVNVGVIKLLAERLTGVSGPSTPGAEAPQGAKSYGKTGKPGNGAHRKGRQKKVVHKAKRRGSR